MALLERAPGFLGFGRSKGIDASSYTGQGLQHILDLAPNMHKYENISTGSAFTSATLASRLIQSEIPLAVRGFLLLRGGNIGPVSIGITNFVRESEFTLHTISQLGINARIGVDGKVKSVDYKTGRSLHALAGEVNKQELVEQLIGHAIEDLVSVRAAWDKTLDWSMKVPVNDALEAIRIREKSFEAMLATGRKPAELNLSSRVKEPSLSS